MEGRDGNDTLTGGGGNDILIGVGTGNAYGGNDIDRLSGGTGEDWFVLGDANGNYYNDVNGYAIITDWNTVPDTVVIDGTRSRSDGGIGLSSQVVPNVGTGAEDLVVFTSGGRQAVLLDDGNLLNQFQADIDSWVATGSNTNASGANNGYFWIV
jgi:Ca2+-binding RTX toxin-like protein